MFTIEVNLEPLSNLVFLLIGILALVIANLRIARKAGQVESAS